MSPCWRVEPIKKTDARASRTAFSRWSVGPIWKLLSLQLVRDELAEWQANRGHGRVGRVGRSDEWVNNIAGRARSYRRGRARR